LAVGSKSIAIFRIDTACCLLCTACFKKGQSAKVNETIAENLGLKQYFTVKNLERKNAGIYF